jgi:flagellin
VIATKEDVDVTFSNLRTGDKVTVAGLTFTAAADVSAADVAIAFHNKLKTVSASPAVTVGAFSSTLNAAWELKSQTVPTSSVLKISAVTAEEKTGAAKLAVSTTNVTLPAINVSQGSEGSVAASTVYGTVTLNSNSAFTIRPGDNAYPSASANNQTVSARDATFSNFTQLGFNADTINAKSIGRLSFQVGPSPDQLISIDLADFGQNGEITGAITSSRAPTNILTVQSANDVTQSVNKSLDMIAQTRASMGAVMNRLEHVIDNLTNVVMNSEASRSQIEDADYAKASTELARTQIMQQAATAVLAQANTSQQSVLKLLQA